MRTAFAMILLGVSPIPIGRIPGRLSRGIRRQATKALMSSGSMGEQQILHATAAMAWHRLCEADLKDEQILLQA